MTKRRPSPLPVLMMLLAAAASSCGGPPEGVFAGTTKIVLAKDSPTGPTKQTVEVTDTAEVAKFVAAIRLQKKNPCACLHREQAVFTAPARAITVSLCDHCFDFDGKTYEMPEEFYELFQAKFE